MNSASIWTTTDSVPHPTNAIRVAALGGAVLIGRAARRPAGSRAAAHGRHAH